MYVEGYNTMSCYLPNHPGGTLTGDILKYTLLLYFNDVVTENVSAEQLFRSVFSHFLKKHWM